MNILKRILFFFKQIFSICFLFYKKFIFLFLFLFCSYFSWSKNANPNSDEDQLNQARYLASRPKGIQKGRALLPKSRKTFKKIKKKTLLKYAKPPTLSHLYFPEGTNEAELEKITSMEINQLYKILKTSKRPDIQIRLASLYVEMGKLIESRIYEQYTEQLELYKAGKQNTLPQLNLNVVQNYFKKAVNLFQIYIQRYPKSKRADEVLFHLGYSYFQLGKANQGKINYERLIRQYPKSLYLEDAYFHLGEYYFDTRNWKSARSYYDKVSRFNAKFYSFSIYKIAWCFYNEGKVEKAMNFMVRVINNSKKSSRFSFVHEALNDLSSFYVYSKYSPREADSFFKALVPSDKHRLRIMKKLAYAYKDVGNNKGLRYIFRFLIERDPYNPQAYDYKYQIVQAYAYSENRTIFNKEFREWLQYYGRDSAWSKANKSNSALINKALNLMEVTLRNYTFRMHHSFAKTKSNYAKNQALFGYSFYVRYFSDSKHASDIYFHYGEMLFDLGQFKKAAEQYEVVVNKYPKSDKHEPSALNRVLALEKIIPTEKEVRLIVKKNPGKSIPFPPIVKKFENSIQKYIQYYSKRKKAPNMIYLIANLHSEYRHYDRAVEYWMKIIKNYPSKKDPIFSRSARAVIDTYSLKKDYKSLKKVSKIFLANPIIRSFPLAGEIQKILGKIQFNEAQEIAKKGNLKLSAKIYENFAKESQNSTLVVSALFNASLNYKKLNNISKTIQLHNKLNRLTKGKKYPKIRFQVLKNLPDLYQRTGQYLQAARFFETYALTYPKDKNVPGFWYNSAIIYDGFNFYDKAVSAYLKYYNNSKSLDRHQVYYLIAQMRHREGKLKKAIGNYERYIRSPWKNDITKVKSAFQTARLNKILGFKAEELKWYKKTIQLYKAGGQGSDFAAQAQFELAYQVYKNFKNIRTTAQTLNRKLKLLETLKNQLKDVIRLNYSPEVVSSLTLMGLAHRHLGHAILHAPLPKGLSRSDMDQYKKGIAQTAQPFQKSADQYFDQAIQKSKKIKGYFPWLKEAEKAVRSSAFFQEKTYFLQLEGL